MGVSPSQESCDFGQVQAVAGTGPQASVVAAVQGWVMTLAIELVLAADIRIAAPAARFNAATACRSFS